MSNYKSLSSLELHSSDKELKENKINEDINNLQDKIEKINEFESQMKETMIKLTNLGKNLMNTQIIMQVEKISSYQQYMNMNNIWHIKN